MLAHGFVEVDMMARTIFHVALLTGRAALLYFRWLSSADVRGADCGRLNLELCICCDTIDKMGRGFSLLNFIWHAPGSFVHPTCGSLGFGR